MTPRRIVYTLTAIAALLTLSACGDKATSAPAAEFYKVEGFDVTRTEAPTVDLSAYGTDLAALYNDLPGYKCEPLSIERDITGAMYLADEDCPDWIEGTPNPRSPYTVRIHEDAAAAVEAMDLHTESGNVSHPVYRAGNVTVSAETQDDLTAFIEAFGG